MDSRAIARLPMPLACAGLAWLAGALVLLGLAPMRGTATGIAVPSGGAFSDSKNVVFQDAVQEDGEFFDVVVEFSYRSPFGAEFPTIPEPSTGLLVSLGLVGLGARRRRLEICS